jgi:hypothetical protein
VGASTDAARAEVLASRQLLLVEVGRLEAAGRSAIDIPAKIRKSPVKTAALIAATGFMVVGGPKRTYRAARQAIFGPTAELPKSMLPEQIERALKALGDDGNVVRGVLEREFVEYLETNKGVRESRDLKGTVSELGGNILRPVTSMAGKRLAEGVVQAGRRQLQRCDGSHPVAPRFPQGGEWRLLGRVDAGRGPCLPCSQRSQGEVGEWPARLCVAARRRPDAPVPHPRSGQR